MSLARKIWGVDSAGTVDQELFNYVRSQFGLPKYWGRYLSEIPNVSSGLTKEEISFLRDKGIKVLPIYNVIKEAVGYDQAQIGVRNAVYHARRLGFPKETILFANIENSIHVDSLWIRVWVETLIPTGYRPGFYYDSLHGDFAKAYCQAAKENNEVAIQAILWSVEPETGATSERKAPRFNPAIPNCKANVWVWQYGRDANQYQVDTNLADDRLLNFLF